MGVIVVRRILLVVLRRGLIMGVTVMKKTTIVWM